MAVYAGCYGKKEPTYVGCVVDKYEHNGYHDSYWYAVCWNRDRQELVNVEYDTTAAAGGGWAEIDATEDVLRELYRKHKGDARRIFDSYGNEAQAKKVRIGDNVIVVRGRKTPKATTGKVFWKGEKYNPYSRTYEKRIGMENADGQKVFLLEEYVLPIGWQDRLLHGTARKRYIRNDAVRAMPIHYQHLFEGGKN